MEYNNLCATLTRLKNFCRTYLREVVEISIRSILLLISTALLSLVVLYFYSILWHIFRFTYSGKKFIMQHPEATSVISNIVKTDIIEHSIHTTFSAFVICLIICAICQVTYIARYLYYAQSIPVKLLFWGMPLTAVVSIYINTQIQLAHWSYTLPLTIIPTLCVFTYCFKFTETLLPEFGDIIKKIFQTHKYFSALPPTGNDNP